MHAGSLTEGMTYRQTDKQMGRQTDRQTDRQTNKQTVKIFIIYMSLQSRGVTSRHCR